LKKSLIFAAGCDEETGSRYGFQWLAKNQWHKIESEFAINEASGDPIKTPKGQCFTVALGEKGRLDAKVIFKGRSCHASVPWEGDNALVKMAHAIQRINEYKSERDLSAMIFRELPRFFDVNESEMTPNNIDNLIEKLSKDYNSIAYLLRGLSRMTITPTMASGGVKSNVIPDLFTLTCDVRVLPGQNIEYVKRELNTILDGIEGYDLTVSGTENPGASSSSDEFLNSIKLALSNAIGNDVDTMQVLTVGLTDSCAVRQFGTTVYDFAPAHPDSDSEKNNVHGDNESFSVKDLIFRTKVLMGLAYNLLV
jgi:carboxypeptidase PM20D1